MFDLPPDLPRLRTLETYARLQLHLITEAIKAAERRDTGDRSPAKPQEPSRPPAPAAPDWLVEPGITAHPSATVHVGDCWVPGKKARPATREQAVEALGEHGGEACDVCRPDTDLGLL
ncbi:DUF6233 domain-containing protein [Streptomyces sp. NPDC057539]|uniref:DUF6233 domain-containing protein n=1 Tax=Streptomyces sp. NPDC057539 TaxID=3346159 RepID=UPI0036C747EA